MAILKSVDDFSLLVRVQFKFLMEGNRRVEPKKKKEREKENGQREKRFVKKREGKERSAVAKYPSHGEKLANREVSYILNILFSGRNSRET